MTTSSLVPLGLLQRLRLAWQVLFDPLLARRVVEGAPGTPQLDRQQLDRQQMAAPPPPTPTVEKTPAAADTVDRAVNQAVDRARVLEEGALHLLAILQRDGRLVDFLHEDMRSFSDAEVGAAARLVHDGCKKALEHYVVVKPLRTEAEGAAIVVDVGFDPGQIRLAGEVKAQPPYRGTLTHAGWRAVDVKLPARPTDVDARVVAPAEVEVR